MTLNSSGSSPLVVLRRGCARLSRLGVAVLLSLGLVVTATACGKNVQTLNPYTPANGVNFDAGAVRIRDLLVLSQAKGEGFLSATLVSTADDALLGITGNAMKADGSEGAPLTTTLTTPVTLTNGAQVVLTDRPSFITVRSPDLEQGLTVKLVLRFQKAGEVSTTAPVLAADAYEYKTVTPQPSGTTSS